MMPGKVCWDCRAVIGLRTFAAAFFLPLQAIKATNRWNQSPDPTLEDPTLGKRGDMNPAIPDHIAQAAFYADQSRADTWVVTVIGEVDLASRDRFDAVVERALADSPSKLVFDLTGARFLDSSVLRVLIAAADGTASLEVRAPAPAVRRLIELSGLTELLPMVE